jgi:hypothetical protein
MELPVFKVAVLFETSFVPAACLPFLFFQTQARLWGAIGKRADAVRTGRENPSFDGAETCGPAPPGS